MTIDTFREFSFEAAHELPPYSGLHGHTFVVRVHLTGEPDPVYGWAENLYEVDKLIEEVRADLDHTCLNRTPGLEVPSLENLARYIWNRLAGATDKLARVHVERGNRGQCEGCSYAA